MLFENFNLHAEPVINNAVCRKCHNNLIEVANGFLSRAWFCATCEAVYLLRLIKAPSSAIGEGFLAQCKATAEAKAARLRKLRQEQDQ